MDGLDAVQWVRVPERWGFRVSGSAIPGLPRQLASAAPDEVWSVGADLHELVIHGHSGGYRWTAELVVPFLTRLCGSPDGHVVAVAIELLTEIAYAQPFVDEVEGADPGMPARIRAELLKERPFFQSLSGHPEARVRSEAADLLASIDAGHRKPPSAGVAV
ncbi:hypothetical protein [Kitasatospora albolonga]|uniref:hypothetical protein n=1 Tax=Kitasatospora albolonga TaxID=68173 RepID=UPI0035E635DC